MSVKIEIESISDQWEIAKSYMATVSADGYSFKVRADYAHHLEQALKSVARPSAETDGVEARIAHRSHYDGTKEGSPWVYEWFLRPLSVPEGSSIETGRYYAAGTFGAAEPVETPVEPSFAVVAIDETRNWAGPVVQLLGRIKGIYVYDRAQHTHLAEFTPSYWLQFSRNDYERDFDEEEDRDAAFNSVNYHDVSEFEHDNGGEYGMYVHCHTVDAMAAQDAVGMPDGWVDEYMLEEDAEAREKMHQEALVEIGADTWSFEPFPEGRSYRVPEQAPTP